MKKHGFTLMEVLVTLGIIGVVSALVLPSFITNVSGQKIGPRLSKAVATFTQATAAILHDAGDANALNEAVVSCHGTQMVLTNAKNCFFENIEHHIRGAYDSSTETFLAQDGVSYSILGNFINNASGDYPNEVYLLGPSFTTASEQLISGLIIDINGDAGPNKAGRDRFYFHLMNDGSLRPFGGVAYDTGCKWTVKCPKGSNPTTANAPFCTAHIVENNWKAEYNVSSIK